MATNKEKNDAIHITHVIYLLGSVLKELDVMAKAFRWDPFWKGFKNFYDRVLVYDGPVKVKSEQGL
jgi:predicted glycosyltransferase